MNLRHFRYFVVAAAEGSIRRASERLHVAQPALSRQIQELEGALGVKLFDRTSKGVRLTQSGELFYSEVRSVLDQIQAITVRTQRASRGQIGILRVGFSNITAEHKGAFLALAEARRCFPEVDFRCSFVDSRRQLSALRHRDIDVGLLYHRHAPSKPEIVYRNLREERILLAVPRSHPLAARKRVQLGDLQSEDMVFASSTNHAFFYQERWGSLNQSSLNPKVVVEVASETVALNMIAAGMGVGFVLSSVSERHPIEGVRYIGVDDFDLKMQMSVIWEESRETPTIRHLAELLFQNLSE